MRPAKQVPFDFAQKQALGSGRRGDCASLKDDNSDVL
jgi:hypothetical protein